MTAATIADGKPRPKVRRLPRGAPPLTQPRYAVRLQRAMAALGVSNAELARRTGLHPSTVANHRSVHYARGIPRPPTRRRTETALGLPQGYLDGLVDCDLQRLAREQRPRGPSEAEVRRRLLQMVERGMRRAQQLAAVELTPAYRAAVLSVVERATPEGGVSLADAVAALTALAQHCRNQGVSGS